MTSETDHRPVGESGSSRWRPHRPARPAPGRGLVRTVAFGLLAIVLAGLVLVGLRSVLDWPPFGNREIDRSGPAVLTAMRDLADYHAASGSYQVVIDLEEDAQWVPDVLKGKRTIFLAIGSVDAFVDFRSLGADAVRVSSDRRSVTLRLPRAQLARPTVDPRESRVLDRDLGLLDRLGGVFSDDPNPQDQRLWRLAEERLSGAAKQVGLTERAEANTRTTLARLLGALGFRSVDIQFVDKS